ncbi:MAG: ribosome maturation factor RimM [Alicyclobacillaceae bacterium]|uniref:ribosome maturation factor RimM n=1 Tax=Alicyclobacillus sp. SP_1 TaxID=2942475 RepID=UPI0021570F5D|nr:ribosome maturation factor RimM [Alicyclobacillus sp. SP_1]MCY0886893.1 ribosome maturation factor RimM [Alicyclobacillaceae bacterium]MCY0895906.1 ribosome maturation factor RimM [Alicyclobacillaceae bacterium]
MNQVDSGPYYAVGTIVGPHALLGEVKVFPRTDFPDRRFSKNSKLWLRRPGEKPMREIVVEGSRKHSKYLVVRFRGIDTVDEAQVWKGMELCVHERDLYPLPEGHFYIHQLLHLTVKTEDGQLVGEIVDVLQPGANDVYVVRGPLQSKDVLLPAIPSCVLDVNIESREMTVHLLPGLLDEEDAP